MACLTALAAAALVSACAVAPSITPGIAEALPAAVELGTVPFTPQLPDRCGPASLASLLGASGITRSAEALEKEVFLPGRKGSLQAELLAATRRADRLPYVIDASLDALLSELAARRPVLVLMRPGFTPLADWHYALAVGYDLNARLVVLRSGAERRLIMDFGAFERSWARANRWAFVALRDGELPARANEQRFVEAAIAVEKVSPPTAERAYRTALLAWPDDLAARIGLGNAAYRQGDAGTAISRYREAIEHHPEAADAWNNLAQALHETGDHAAALVAARHALQLGGPRTAVYQATLAEIEDRTP